MTPSRRSLLAGFAALAAGSPARGQVPPGPRAFRFEDVARRARELASVPFDPGIPPLPEPFAGLDEAAYREIRFRPERALLATGGAPFRLQLFHLGGPFTRPVTINLVRDGVPTPIAYQPGLFEYGRTRVERPVPVNLGFSGFRLHHPLNDPRVFDELVAFLGGCNLRFLGRGQSYGLTARAVAINADGDAGPEETPFFREFWVEAPAPDAARIRVTALLDAPALAGAYEFAIEPGETTRIEVRATLHPRRTLTGIGLAPLASAFLRGENDRRIAADYRPERHDSDGLLMLTGAGEWIWRPLRNAPARWVSSFHDRDPRGFGLLQRDRAFASYQDIEGRHQDRPGYFVEPRGAWGEGRVVLIEDPAEEPRGNVFAYWAPKRAYEAGAEVSLAYGLRSVGAEALHPGARVVNTFVARAGEARTRRFLVDFAGGDLPYFLADPGAVEAVASTSAGRASASVQRNDAIGGFRATIEVALDAPGQAADLRAFLRAGRRTLSETWTMPWVAG